MEGKEYIEDDEVHSDYKASQVFVSQKLADYSKPREPSEKMGWATWRGSLLEFNSILLNIFIFEHRSYPQL